MRVFFHVAAMNDSWYGIYREVYDEIVRSGLLAEATKLVVGFLGSPGDFSIVAEELVGDKYELLYFGPDLSQYEFPTINALQEFCKTSNEPVMYCHTKGVSNPTHLCKKYWRRAMMKSVITDWRRCVEDLRKNDLVGYNLHRPRKKGDGPMHFSGNWWWARPSYIRECAPVMSLKENPRYINNWMVGQVRFQCEFWLRTGPYLKAIWKSTGVGDVNREYSIDPIVELDPGDRDPFDFAGLPVSKRYLINMEGQDDRLESGLIEISNAGIRDVEVFRAVVPNSLEGTKLSTRGQLGCYLSHKEIIKEVYEKGYDSVLILEDDVQFQYRFREVLASAIGGLPKDWDVLFIGSYEKNRGPYVQIKDRIWKTGNHWGTHCYLISKNGLEKLYNYLENNPIEWEIDMLMVHHMPDLRKYSINPTLAHQKPFKSNTRLPKDSLTDILKNIEEIQTNGTRTTRSGD